MEEKHLRIKRKILDCLPAGSLAGDFVPSHGFGGQAVHYPDHFRSGMEV